MKKAFLAAGLAFFASACGTPPALYRAAEGGNAAQVNALLAAGGNPNEQFHPWKNMTALHRAAASGQVAAATALLERGANPNIQALSPVPFHKPHNRGTALHYAACTGSVEMVKLLLAHGADPEPCVGECENPLPNGFFGAWESGTPLQLAEFHGHGAVDPDSAKKLGKLLGADLLVVGSVDDLPGNLLEVNLRLASVESGEAVSAASGQLRKDWLN